MPLDDHGMFILHEILGWLIAAALVGSAIGALVGWWSRGRG